MKQKSKKNTAFWLSLSLFGLMGQIAWVVENMYLNVFMYKMFNASASDISFMVGASAVAATLTTLLVGALSDRIGRRKIFICLGYILWGISILAFSVLKVETISRIFFPEVSSFISAAALCVTLTIILDCVMTFFGSSANDAAFNAWLTDSTDSSNRGAAEGINAMMPLMAILVVFGGFMAFDLEKSESWSMIFTVIGTATILIGILGFFIIKEKKNSPSETGYFKNLIYGFRPSTVKANPKFYIYLVLFIIFNISIQIFMPYLIIYYEVSLGMTDYVFVMAPAILIASAVTALWGRVYDKKGFSFSGTFSILWLIAGYIILFFTRTTIPVFLGSLLMMSGYLAGMAVFGAKIRDLTPTGKAGMLQGVRIFSQVLVPGVVGPFIGKAVLSNADTIINSDGTESFVPSAGIFAAALIPIIILAVALIIFENTRKKRLCSLKTPFESKDSQTYTWDEYPRPQLRRASYLSLCGEWELYSHDNKRERHMGRITVPFPPESDISGIGKAPRKNELFIYRRQFVLPHDMRGKRIILHFGAADQEATVILNGIKAGAHTGGYLPFEFDITDLIKDGDNSLEVFIKDSLDHTLAYGKQRRKRGGMWYTPISGLWKQVWLESVPENYIRSIKMTPSLDGVTLEIDGGKSSKKLSFYDGQRLRNIDFEGNTVKIMPENINLWTPEAPYLYEFTLTDGCDTVESYFALRTVSVKQVEGRSYICLNDKPYYFHGLLDQGYFSDGIYTPASPDGFIYDIKKMKSLGFNMLRKHIKVEHELFYYYCDKYGMAVFQDMVNSGNYSFLIDTALPTLGLKKGISHYASKKRAEYFESDSKEMIDLLYNHPSVIYYTVFNEGWGQYDADRVYSALKAHDPTRIYDATSGWFSEKDSDVTSEHIYFKPLCEKNMSWRADRPMVLSEFGGYSCKIAEHSFNLDRTYGYSTCKTPEDLEKALISLYRDQVIPQIRRGLCASVYTQVSDVEDETNGLVTYDRQTVKVGEDSMRKISDELQAAFKENFST